LIFTNSHKLIFAIVVLIFVSTSVSAQKAKEEKYYINNNRHWFAEIPLWVPGFRGQLSYSDFDFSSSGDKEEKEYERVDSDTGIEFYFVGRIAAQYNKFWVQADAFSGGVSSAFSYTSPIKQEEKEFVNIKVQGTIPRLVFGYAVWEKSTESSFKIELVPYIGVRYVSIHLNSDVFDTTNRIDVRPNYFEAVIGLYTHWFEPLIGLYSPIVYKRFKLEIQADYGINGKNNSWIISNRYRYAVSKLVDVQLGWNYVRLHYKGMIDNEELEAAIKLFGPTAGIGFRF